MTKEPQVIEHWINMVNIEGRDLTKWEEDFMFSITEQWAARKSISDKQEAVLERIYVHKTPT